MKHLLLLFFIVVGFNCIGQSIVQEEPQFDVKPKFNYIIVWRTWEHYFRQQGDVSSPDSRWRIECVGFDTQKELIDWINVSNSDGWGNRSEHQDKYTRITENQFIMAYDFVNAKKLTITFKTVNKSLPKRIEVSEEKWTETTAEIKN